MSIAQSFLDAFFIPLQSFWQGSIVFLPKLVKALIILVVGWFLAFLIGKLIFEIFRRIKLDSIFDRMKWNEALSKADLKMTVSEFIGSFVKWVLIVVFLVMAVEVLGGIQFSYTLSGLINWLPNLLVAVAIFIVAAIFADFAEKLSIAVVSKMNVRQAKVLGLIVRYSIWIVALFAILSELGVASDIVKILMGGLVALIVLSGAIAFGLGGKDMAKEILEDLKKKMQD